MSESILYGLAPNELRPGPDFSASVDATGKWTGSQTFSCRKFDYSSYEIQNKLAKGTPITVLYSNLGPEWKFLTIDSHSHEHQPGGITRVIVNLSGSGGEGVGASGEATYSLNASTAEMDITTHPKFLECTQSEAMIAIFNGQATRAEWRGSPTDIVVQNAVTQEDITTITDSSSLAWYDVIFRKGFRTWQAPVAEWTVSKTNTGGLSDEAIDYLGYKHTPQGSPPSFPGRDWMLTSASQTQTKSGSGSVKSWTITWQLSPPGMVWPELIYDKPAP